MAGIVLLSGGQDSSTCLALAKACEDKVVALSVFYGQKHSRELECAQYQAQANDVKHYMIDINGMDFKSALVSDPDSIPKSWNAEQGPAPTIVPGRNSILLSLAASLAESLDIQRIYCGVSAVDYSGYPDCRPEFIKALGEAIRISSQGRVQIVTPLINKTKKQMILIGSALDVDWSKTWTCYRGGEFACGECPSCQLRLEAFRACDMEDPLTYRTDMPDNGPAKA